MKNATRIDEIDDFLRDGGILDDLIIETDPSDKRRVWSKVGMEVIQDQDRHNGHIWYVGGKHEDT